MLNRSRPSIVRPFQRKMRNLLINNELRISGGERGIRTPGTSRYDGFQDRCNRPLYHLSNGCDVLALFLNASAKVHNSFEI